MSCRNSKTFKNRNCGPLIAVLLLFCSDLIASDVEILELGSYTGRQWSDGSGIVGTSEDVENFKDTWSFNVTTDEMTDDQRITLERRAYSQTENFGKIRLSANIHLWINLSDADQEILCVAGHDFPGKQAMIRVDSNAPIETNKKGCLLLDDSLDTKLKAGNRITLRGYQWPYEGAETFHISLAGYTKTVIYLRTLRDK